MAGFHGGEMVALVTEDLQEEEVWAARNPRSEGSTAKSRKNYFSGSSSSSRRSSASNSRAIPRGAVAAGLQDCPATARRSSAPVHIPDWSKILKKHPNKSPWDDDDDDDAVDGKYGIHVRDNEDEDDDRTEIVPPHEYLARRLASTQIASSMCEGVGGTLKGRDLSRLRNAILTKTGFIE